MGNLLIDLKSEFQPGCLRRGATKRGCVKVRHVHSKRACQVKLISVPWPFCCIFAYSGPLAPRTALKKGERLWCFNCPPLLMWRRWFGLAESNTCRCRELCCSGLPFLSFAECKKKEKEMLFEEQATYGTQWLSVGVIATIYPRHPRRGKSADMTRQAVSTENRGVWQSMGS